MTNFEWPLSYENAIEKPSPLQVFTFASKDMKYSEQSFYFDHSLSDRT